jgi:hypothetical protein
MQKSIEIKNIEEMNEVEYHQSKEKWKQPFVVELFKINECKQ